jgi:hypothetical protein
LSRCAEAARASGRLVFISSVGRDETPKGEEGDTLLVDDMHRSAAEHSEQSQEVGLDSLVADRQPSGYFVVECRPSWRNELFDRGA